MDVEPEAGAFFSRYPRGKDNALLLGITIFNPRVSSNLDNVARKHLADAVERSINGTRSPLPTPSFLLPRRVLVRLAQVCMS